MDPESAAGFNVIPRDLLQRGQDDVTFGLSDHFVEITGAGARRRSRKCFDDILRQVLPVNDIRRAQNQGALDYVLQLANIPGPVITAQTFEGFPGDARIRRPAICACFWMKYCASRSISLRRSRSGGVCMVTTFSR